MHVVVAAIIKSDLSCNVLRIGAASVACILVVYMIDVGFPPSFLHRRRHHKMELKSDG